MAKRHGIILKTPEQIEKMRAAGRVVRKVHEHCRAICKPGITTQEIDNQARAIIDESGGTGLFIGYKGAIGTVPFPGNLCISINEDVVHGIPGPREVKDGDIVSVDCGVKLDGWCGDAATTILVGNVDKKVRKLCEDTEHVLQIAIDNIKPGRRWSQVARLMQSYAERNGYGVVRGFVGHGVGESLHEDPQVPNYFSRDRSWKDFELRVGMTLAIEPMCNLGGRDDTEVMSDGWTVKTADRLPSAHYEHSVAVVKSGADVLTDGR
jgi:methionyl aminopeptidase